MVCIGEDVAGAGGPCQGRYNKSVNAHVEGLTALAVAGQSLQAVA